MSPIPATPYADTYACCPHENLRHVIAAAWDSIVMAYVIMAYIVMAYIVMAYIFMAYVVMSYMAMAQYGRGVVWLGLR